MGCWENTSDTIEFLLLGFPKSLEWTCFLFIIFSTIYMMTVIINLLVLITVVVDVHLHSPMYFFLGNLSLVEICYSTTFLPNMLADLLTEDRTISLTRCMTQLSLVGWLIDFECLLLTVMAYDRYVAICRPLHYTTLMNQRLCLAMVISAFLGSTIPTFVNSSLMSNLKFVGRNIIHHFFCDISPVLHVACSDIRTVEIEVAVLAFIIVFIPFLFIMISYICIISAILKIPSQTGRRKAFSTCSSHLTVVAIYFGALISIYMVPSSDNALNLNTGLSLMYTVITPLLNPLIYTLRNKDITEALGNIYKRMCR